jgi:hypothetical protein
LELFREIVEPTLARLEKLLEPGMCHDQLPILTQTDVAQVFLETVYGEMTFVGQYQRVSGPHSFINRGLD